MFDLREISKKFTKTVLEEILSKFHPDKTDIRLTGWELEEGTSKGDNYLSVVRKMTIKGTTNKSNEPIEAKIVIKSLPTNLARRLTFRSVDFFYNEIIFYTEIIPKFREFLSKKGQIDLISIPRCLAALADGRNDYLILEDLSPLDYKSASRENIDLDKIYLITKTMARFHAISLAYKDQHEIEFINLAGRLKETYFSYDHWDWYKRFHKKLLEVAEDALKQEYPNSGALKKFTSYKYGDMFSKCCDFCESSDGESSKPLVINQGDCWAPNFMIRDVGEQQQQVAMLDFQLARYASPVLDLAFFIYSCTDEELRRNHYDDILSIYHQQVKDALTKLGSDPESLFSWQKFKQEVKENSIFGMIFALESIPMSLLDSSEAFDLDEIEGDKKLDIADVWTLSPIKTKNGRRRLADVIVHAYEKDYL